MRRRYRFGILGHRIAYTKSPDIFSMLAEYRRVDIDFDTIDIAPDKLDSAMGRLKECDGFSVTIPFKESLMPYMDDLSDDARIIGAVNSVKVTNGKLIGHNTDAVGFMSPLREAGFAGGRILVLGAGGAARAVVYALKTAFRQAAFSVCGRNAERVGRFVADIGKRYGIAKRMTGLTFDRMEPSGTYDLIVNCTPMGGMAYPGECLLPGAFSFEGLPLCYDLVYEPAETVFLARAAQAGCKTIGGISMLIRQAVESYTIWTGDDFDKDAAARGIVARLYHATKGDNS